MDGTGKSGKQKPGKRKSAKKVKPILGSTCSAASSAKRRAGAPPCANAHSARLRTTAARLASGPTGKSTNPHASMPWRPRPTTRGANGWRALYGRPTPKVTQTFFVLAILITTAGYKTTRMDEGARGMGPWARSTSCPWTARWAHSYQRRESRFSCT